MDDQRDYARTIVKDDTGTWIDPEAPATPDDGDDYVWRESCDESPHFDARHEPRS